MTQTTLSTAALEELTQTEKEVYRSVEIEGVRPVDIARHSGRSPSTIRTILSRARRKTENGDKSA